MNKIETLKTFLKIGWFLVTSAGLTIRGLDATGVKVATNQLNEIDKELDKLLEGVDLDA